MRKYLGKGGGGGLLVLGAAAHIPFTVDFEAVIAQVSREHQLEFPDLPLFWKTSQPGGCSLRALTHLPSEQVHRSTYAYMYIYVYVYITYVCI